MQVWLEQCRAAYSALTSEKLVRDAAELKKENAKTAAQPDDLIDFVQLKSKKGLSQIEIEDEVTTGESVTQQPPCSPHSQFLSRPTSNLVWPT